MLFTRNAKIKITKLNWEKRTGIWKILRANLLLKSIIIKKETKSTYLKVIVNMRNSKVPIKKKMTTYLIYFMYVYCIDSEQGKDKVNKSQSISLVNTEVK